MIEPAVPVSPPEHRAGLEFVGAVDELVRAANEGASAEGLLRTLCDCACDVPGVAAASVSTVDDAMLRQLPRAAIAAGTPRPTLADGGVESVSLRSGGQEWGELQLHRSHPWPLSAASLAMAHALADLTASYLLLESRRDQESTRLADLEHRASHDELTGLSNRALMFERLGRSLEGALSDGTHVAVMFLDIDDFKGFNDSLGHLAGDTILAEAARRLATVVRTSDHLARFSGDEFVIVCPGLSGSRETVDGWLRTLAHRLQTELRRPCDLDEVDVVLSVSIGIEIWQPGTTAHDLIRLADEAMYRAKRRGRGFVVVGPDRPALRRGSGHGHLRVV